MYNDKKNLLYQNSTIGHLKASEKVTEIIVEECVRKSKQNDNKGWKPVNIH